MALVALQGSSWGVRSCLGDCRLYGVAVLWVSLWKGLLGIRPSNSHTLWAGFSVAQVTCRMQVPQAVRDGARIPPWARPTVKSELSWEDLAFMGHSVGNPGGLPGGGGDL